MYALLHRGVDRSRSISEPRNFRDKKRRTAPMTMMARTTKRFINCKLRRYCFANPKLATKCSFGYFNYACCSDMPIPFFSTKPFAFVLHEWNEKNGEKKKKQFSVHWKWKISKSKIQVTSSDEMIVFNWKRRNKSTGRNVQDGVLMGAHLHRTRYAQFCECERGICARLTIALLNSNWSQLHYTRTRHFELPKWAYSRNFCRTLM